MTHLSAPRLALSAELTARDIALRPQTETDVDFLRSLYIVNRWPEVAQLVDWTDEQRLAFLADQFRLQHLHYTTHYADAEFTIVEWEGQPIGRLGVFRNSKDLRIVDIVLRPEIRSHGVGRHLIESVFAEARQTNRTVSIHVEVFNPARRLYDRLGFRQVEETGPYLLMVWSPAAVAG